MLHEFGLNACTLQGNLNPSKPDLPAASISGRKEEEEIWRTELKRMKRMLVKVKLSLC
jgi:hypothetical protein